jgi:2-hydroxy-6-oxonona-2,4-dienedioate hydrolase
MERQQVTTVHRQTGLDRYRQAEETLWRLYGLEPRERFVELADPRCRLRVVEVGSGPPIVFFPGTMVTGPAWGALVGELAGYRCLLVDRPGEGLSEPVAFRAGGYAEIVTAVTRGLFDALRLEGASVVGHSIGNVWALRTALAVPTRVDGIVLLGGGPVVEELETPGFLKLLASPLGAIIVRMPFSPGRARSMMRDSGHGPSIDAGRIPPQLIDWLVAFQRDTSSMRAERAMVRTVVGRGGWQPGLTLSESDFTSLLPALTWIVGSDDPIGSIDLWTRVAARMPQADVHVVDRAGHLPWLDDPAKVGDLIRLFLAAKGNGEPTEPRLPTDTAISQPPLPP